MVSIEGQALWHTDMIVRMKSDFISIKLIIITIRFNGKTFRIESRINKLIGKKGLFFNDAESIISISFLYLIDFCLSFVYNLLNMYLPAERYNRN